MSSNVPFDRRTLIDNLGGDLELYGEIARIFLDHYPLELDNLQHALTAGDAGKMHRIAHSLKGAISNFSAPRATAAARNLEMSLKDGMCEQAAALVEETLIAVRELGDAMRADLSGLKV